jgi:hypothetical protein
MLNGGRVVLKSRTGSLEIFKTAGSGVARLDLYVR